MHSLAARVVIIISSIIFSVWGNGIERRSWQFNTSLSTPLLVASEREDFCHPGKMMQSEKLNQSSLNELYTQFVCRYANIDKQKTIHTCKHTFIATSNAHFSVTI